jgi:hypothetical protein
MTDRVHILMDRAEKERFRALAGREGKSLTRWQRPTPPADFPG